MSNKCAPIPSVAKEEARQIPARLEVCLARYALLAGAAIASSKPAMASVVTTLLPTPVDLLSSAPYAVDFNGDSVNDFVFFTGATVFSTLGLYISGFTAGLPQYLPFNGGHGGSTGVAYRYSVGDVVSTPYSGKGFTFDLGGLLDDYTSPGDGFLGVEFVDILGTGISSHFGFFELNGVSLVGWAYETSANTPITVFDLDAAVPEPNSFELLALGAAGLVAVRKLKPRK